MVKSVCKNEKKVIKYQENSTFFIIEKIFVKTKTNLN